MVQIELFFKLIKTVMNRRRFFVLGGTHVQSSLLPQFALLFLLVSTILGLRVWSDDLNVVQFKFLEDDTKLAQSCTDWLYVQHWYTFVPDPAMRVTLWALMRVAMIVTSALKTHGLSFSFFSCRSDLRHHCECTSRQRSAWCLRPAQLSISVLCFMQLHHQTIAVAGASLRRCGTTARFVKCVTQFFSLPNFCGRSQCRRHQSLSLLLFVFRVVLSDNF